MNKNIKAVPTADYNSVIAVAQKYVDGLRAGSVEQVAEAFHDDAVMYGFTNGQLLGGQLTTCTNLSRRTGKRRRSLRAWTFWRSRLLLPSYVWTSSRMPSAQTTTTTSR
jgi:hypothetical protein